ncbi:diacylglycerol kinase 3-like [Primulina huaijiensis]|uniref:diacylglycerol kinase 3-like n=1 Tax=Primulina huaijiensis TaxID=1492673 RepID=UPI003CC71168
MVLLVGSLAVLESLTNRVGCQFLQQELYHLGQEMICLGVLTGAGDGSFLFNWKSTIKRTLDKIADGPIGHLDRCLASCFVISMPAKKDLDIPYSLKPTKETPLDQVCGVS